MLSINPCTARARLQSLLHQSYRLDRQTEQIDPPSLPLGPRLAVCTLAGMLAFCICRSPNSILLFSNVDLLALYPACRHARLAAEPQNHFFGFGIKSSGERLFQSHFMKKNPIHRHPLRPNQPTLSTPSPCSSGRPRENSIRLLSAFSIPHLTWVFLECDERGPSIVIQLRVLDYLSGRSRTPSPRLPTLTILVRIRQLCLNDHVQARLADAETRLSCLTRSRAPRSHPLDHADIDYRY